MLWQRGFAILAAIAHEASYSLYTISVCAFKDGDNELRGEKMQEELWPYYRGLIEKYGLGGKLKW